MENRFIQKFESKSDDELKYIAANPDSYAEDALEAAVYLLEERTGSNDSETTELRKKLERDKTANLEKEKIREKEFTAPKDLPKNVKMAAYLIYSSLGIGILKMAFIQYNIPDLAIKGTSIVTSLSIPAVLIFIAYQISLGKNWARITFSVLTILGFIVTPGIIVEQFIFADFLGFASVFQTIIQLIALILLWTTPVRDWFHTETFKKIGGPEVLDEMHFEEDDSEFNDLI